MCLQGLYWMLFCVSVGFISMILLGRGLTNSQIGIVTSIFGILSALLQPTLGNLCDRFDRLSWKNILPVMLILYLLICFFMFFVPGKLAGALAVGLLLLLGNAIMPFINSILASYQYQGITINFGIARGIGSFMYALLALIIGQVANIYGERCVPLFGMIVSVLMLLLLVTLPYYKGESQEKTEITREASQKGKTSFVQKYPTFILMIIGCVFLLTSHNVTGTYLLQILQNIGGTSVQYGTTLSLQAVLEVPVLFCFSYLYKKMHSQSLMALAAFGYCLKALSYVLISTMVGAYIIQMTQMISFAIYASASVYYTMDSIKKEDQVTGQALMTSVVSLGTVLGSLIGGFVIDLFGMKTLLILNTAIAFLGMCIVFLSLFLSAKTKKTECI